MLGILLFSVLSTFLRFSSFLEGRPIRFLLDPYSNGRNVGAVVFPPFFFPGALGLGQRMPFPFLAVACGWQQAGLSRFEIIVLGV